MVLVQYPHSSGAMSIQFLIGGLGTCPPLPFLILLVVDFCCLVFFLSVMFSPVGALPPLLIAGTISTSCAVVDNVDAIPVAPDAMPVLFAELGLLEHSPLASQQLECACCRSLSSISLARRRRIRIVILSLKSRRNRATS